MDFRAIWASVAGAIRALVSYLGEFEIGARVVAWLHRVRLSFVALVSSKAVWAAVIVIGIGAWSAGYVTAAGGKRALRSEAVGLRLKLEQTAAAERLARENEQRQLLAHSVTTQRLDEAQDEVARLKRLLEGRSASAAAVSRKPAAKEPAPQPAAGGSPKWAPWQ